MMNVIDNFLLKLNLNNTNVHKYMRNNQNIKSDNQNIRNSQINNNRHTIVIETPNRINSSILRCSNPEHHNVNDKIGYFDRRTSSYYPDIPFGFPPHTLLTNDGK